MLAFKDDSSRAVGVGDDAFTDRQAGGSQGIGGNRDLVFRTDPSGSSAAILYICQDSKANREWCSSQPFCSTNRRSIGPKTSCRTCSFGAQIGWRFGSESELTGRDTLHAVEICTYCGHVSRRS